MIATTTTSHPLIDTPPASRIHRLSMATAAMASAGILALLQASPASADPSHTSYMNTPYCLSVPGVPGDCTGFIIGKYRTLQMNCFEGGPQALGSGKWFRVTVLGTGSGYGAYGDVPANAVSNQWNSSPHC